MSFNDKQSYGNDELQPIKKLCTAGDVLIKRLASKQINKHVEITKEFMEDDRFVSLQHFEAITKNRVGTCSAADLEDDCKNLEELENLKSAGLSNSDIQFYLNDNNDQKKRYKNVEETALQMRIERINNQISAYRSKITDVKAPEDIRRNILLLEKPNSNETRLLEFSLKNVKPTEQTSHPMDTIKSIETDLFSHLSESTNVRGMRNKNRKLNNRISKLQCELESHVRPLDLDINRKTNWDVCNSNQIISTSLKAATNYSCLPLNYYTVRNDEIIKLSNTNKCPVQISEEKLSIESIKSLEKFSNYQVGTPSKVLYVRNLAYSITENDLKTIFKLYEENITSYKLLAGRLKGRAFISFNDEMSCTAAVDKLNGYFVRNKPMIFEYGKRAA